MVDPISIAKDIIAFGLTIKEIIDEVKAFKEYAERLQFKIEHMMPPLETIADMENQREALAAAQKSEPEMKTFTKSLSQMLSLLKEVKVFIESFKEMNALQQLAKKDKIKKNFETYDYKLDTLQRSIHMGVLVEFKKEADAGRIKQDSVKILVRHVKRASNEKNKPMLKDDIPMHVIASDDLEPIEQIGEGGFAKVLLAKYKQGERVAVKIFDVGNNRSILKEVAKMRQAILSPYMVRLRGLIDEPGTHGIVMDYFEYGSLKSFLPYLECDCWPRRVRMLCNIASGLNFLHTDLTPPLVHRDIKLSNTFVDHSFTVKLGDLGLASSGTTITKSRSQAYVMGTYSHMAPELWDGTAEDAEPSLDIYGFGISIYEFITGKNPWPPAVKPDMIGGLVLCGKRPNLEFIKPYTPTEVVTMMKKCWQTDPKSRPTSQEILRKFSMLYETHYEAGLLEADKVIRSKIKAEESASLRQQDSSSEGDSGIKSDTQESFEGLNVKDPDTTVKAAAAATGSTTSDSEKAAMASVDESMNAVVLYDYDAVNPDELILKVGQIITNLNMHTLEEGWWEGESNGKRGMFPSNFVKEKGASRRQQGGSPCTEDSGKKSDFQENFEGLNVQDLDTTVKAASATESSRNDSGIATMTAVDETNMTWQYKQTLDPDGDFYSSQYCQMISPNQLAVCIVGCVKVYDVSTTERSTVMYTVSIEEWKGKYISGVAESESLPSSMLVICRQKPYVYQCACKETTQVMNKYNIDSDVKDPWCIVANANTAVIKMSMQSSFLVYKLPGFTQQSCVQIDFFPLDLSITSEYLVIMGENQMLVRSFSDVWKDMYRINPPVGWTFDSVCCKNNAREMYAACKQGDGYNVKGSVYRYTWGGEGRPKYGKPICIIEGLKWVGYRCLSVTSDGLLAVGQYLPREVKIYKLQ